MNNDSKKRTRGREGVVKNGTVWMSKTREQAKTRKGDAPVEHKGPSFQSPLLLNDNLVLQLFLIPIHHHNHHMQKTYPKKAEPTSPAAIPA